MHDIRTAATPLDLEQARTGGGPHFECHTSLRSTLDRATGRSARNDELQIVELEEAGLDVFLDVPERRFDNGPKRLRKEFLQTVVDRERPAGRQGRRWRGARVSVAPT